MVADLATPALIVDVPALDRNIATMARFFADGPCRLRPHVKAHKTPAIAKRQLAAGSCVGLTCATVSEAEAVASLTDDILIANEVIGEAKWARVAALARTLRVTTAVDSPRGAEGLAAAAQAAGVRIGVLVDLDVGQGRCGVRPGEQALSLARLVGALPALELRGVMGYEGHVQPMRDRAARHASAREAMQALVDTAELLRGAGLACPIVSAGGTGTYDVSGRVPGVTEIQAGSYALMDTDYGDVGVPFVPAFFVLGTVVSRPALDRIVLDCGHKSATKDHGPPAGRRHCRRARDRVQRRARRRGGAARVRGRHRRSRAAAPLAHRSHRQPARRVLRHRRRPGRGRVADRRPRLPRAPSLAFVTFAF